MSELIPFSLLSMGLSFIGIGFLLPFYKQGSFLSRRNPHNLGFLLRGTAKLIEKRSLVGPSTTFPYFWWSSAKRGGGQGTTPRLWCENEVRNHDFFAFDHLGIKSMTRRVAEDFYWPSLKNDVRTFVQACDPCAKVKANNKQANLGKFEVPDKRFSHVMVDVVGPLPESYGYKYILTAICRTTRFLHAWPLREATASETASLISI